MEFDLENPLPPSPDLFPALFLTETDHMPYDFYSHTLISSPSILSIRRRIVSSIVDISREFGPFVAYLAVNYMDRFLSVQTMPDENPLIFRLVSVCCVSLALKMKKTDFSISDLMDNGGLICNSATIEKMEMLILGALEWRMRSITPFSFLDYFTSYFDSVDEPIIQAFRNRATQIIFKAQINDIKLLDFRPSAIAASALLYSSQEFFPMQFQAFRDAICGCLFVIEAYLQRCYESMQEAAAEDSYQLAPPAPAPAPALVSSPPLSPDNVLDFSSSISESESQSQSQGNDMSESTADSSGSENRGIRRQETEHFATNNSSHLSQRHH